MPCLLMVPRKKKRAPVGVVAAAAVDVVVVVVIDESACGEKSSVDEVQGLQRKGRAGQAGGYVSDKELSRAILDSFADPRSKPDARIRFPNVEMRGTGLSTRGSRQGTHTHPQASLFLAQHRGHSRQSLGPNVWSNELLVLQSDGSRHARASAL